MPVSGFPLMVDLPLIVGDAVEGMSPSRESLDADQTLESVDSLVLSLSVSFFYSEKNWGAIIRGVSNLHALIIKLESL